MKNYVILKPVKETERGYIWRELEVKQSEQKGAGMGVFARTNLAVGSIIPIVGHRIRQAAGKTHAWTHKAQKISVDGHPSINTYKGVGSFGLSIAMMLNEDPNDKHNCMFLPNSIVVAMPIDAGTELTIYYGNEYDRAKAGYSLDENETLDEYYDDLDDIKMPSNAIVYKIVEKYQMIISELEKKNISTNITEEKKMKATPISVFKRISSDESDQATLKWISSRIFDPNKHDKAGHSMLIFAVSEGKVLTANHLLSIGADLHYTQPNEDNALSTAIYEGHYQIASDLIERGLKLEDIDHLDPDKVELFNTWRLAAEMRNRGSDSEPLSPPRLHSALSQGELSSPLVPASLGSQRSNSTASTASTRAISVGSVSDSSTIYYEPQFTPAQIRAQRRADFDADANRLFTMLDDLDEQDRQNALPPILRAAGFGL